MNRASRIVDYLKSLPEDEATTIAEELIRHHYRSSLFAVARDLCGFKDVCYPTHKSIIEALESPTKRKLIVMPRGSLKSSIGSVAFPIWMILKNPNIRILIDSEIYSNSKNFIREISAHLQYEKIVGLFGDFVGTPWGEGEITIKQRTRNVKEATITASGVDAVKVGQHYDLIIFDDLNSANNSSTEAGCKKVIDHYKLATSILEPNGTIVMIGTRYSENDAIGHILRTEVYPEVEKEEHSI